MPGTPGAALLSPAPGGHNLPLAGCGGAGVPAGAAPSPWRKGQVLVLVPASPREPGWNFGASKVSLPNKYKSCGAGAVQPSTHFVTSEQTVSVVSLLEKRQIKGSRNHRTN